MPAVPTIDTAERRRRVGARHHLAAGTQGDPVTVATDLVGIHATDPASVYLELRARVPGLGREDVARVLYDDRSLVKVLGMRRTMFAVPPGLAAILHAAVTVDLGAAERKRTLAMIEGAGITREPTTWVADVEARTLEALAELGEATAVELTRKVPELGEQIPFGAGKPWQGTFGVSTRLLFLLATEGRIIRGRPRGTWLSSLYRWVPLDRWIPGGLEPWPPEQAQVELVRRWLAAFGPGTRRDVQWWTGWTVARTKRALEGAGAVEVRLEDGTTGWSLPEDVGATPDPGPWVALLPALDATMMAWKDRDWYLGDLYPQLFDRAGNAGPTVWVDGRVVGLWAQRANLEVGYRLLVDVGREARDALDREAARLTEWLGGDRVFPRFPNELYQELAAT